MIIENYDIFNLPLVQNTNLEGYRVPLECYSRSIAYCTYKKLRYDYVVKETKFTLNSN